MQQNHISSALNIFLDDLDFKINHPNEIRDFSTGLSSLDYAFNGIKKGDVILIGSRPGMGKTSFAVHLAHQIASFFMNQENEEKAVLYFNLEMPASFMAERFMSLQTGLSRQQIKTEYHTALVQEKIQTSALSLAKLPIYFSDNGYDIADIESEIQHISQQKEVGFVLIDYLQLMTSASSNEMDYSEMLTQIKALAQKLNIPILILTQLDRALELRESKRPVLSDILGYNKKQTAVDKIIFLYREFYYIQNEAPTQMPSESTEKFQKRLFYWKERISETQNQCDLIIAKNNSGICTIRKVFFSPETGVFKDLD